MINLGLSRITALMAQLPTKQTWKAIHIAGTNGKGSVAAYLSSLLLRLSKPADPNSELKIGRFTSPHLIDRWDCITINDQPVSESLFLRVEREVQSYVPKAMTSLKEKHKSHDSSSNETVTEFELLTATAFEIFSQQNCHVAIIECGLGGRLDATNVLHPRDVACSVITKIGLDHIGILGNTVEAIAREKAGIVKVNVPMVIDGTNPHDTIEAIAIIANAHNVSPHLSRQPLVEDTWSINRAPVIGSMPPHQYNNLVLALETFTRSQPQLPLLTFSAPSHTILPLLLNDVRTSYPARLQHLAITSLFPSYTHPILLDGAHNPQSAEVLKSYLDSLTATRSGFFRTRFPSISKSRAPNPRTWILAMSRGKDVAQILSTILSPDDDVVVCNFSRVDGMPWVNSMPTRTLAEEARGCVERGVVTEAADVLEALEIAVRRCEERRVARKKKDKATGTGDQNAEEDAEIEIVVAGSLYLASDLLRAMRDGPEAVKGRFEIGVAI